MRIIGHGIDLVEVARIAATLDRHPDRFLERVFTPAEAAYAKGHRNYAQHLAARFAAKEAALKALATGWGQGIAWTDIEVCREPSGQPALRISGHAATIAQAQGVSEWRVSLTHTDTHAIASVISLGE